MVELKMFQLYDAASRNCTSYFAFVSFSFANNVWCGAPDMLGGSSEPHNHEGNY
jgi:hypothetical protein